jgi:hypothetical protein
LTAGAFAEQMAAPDSGFDAMAPENVSPLVVWLGSEDAGDVTGRVFEVDGGRICLADGWRRGPTVERDERWPVEEIGPVVRTLIDKSVPPEPVYGAG